MPERAKASVAVAPGLPRYSPVARPMPTSLKASCRMFWRWPAPRNSPSWKDCTCPAVMPVPPPHWMAMFSPQVQLPVKA